MNTVAFAALIVPVLIAAAPASPQSAPQTPTPAAPRPAGDLTRMLNGAPPATVTPPASASARTTAAPVRTAPAVTQPGATPPRAAPVTPSGATPPRALSAPPTAVRPAPTPTPTSPSPPVQPPPPPTVLDTAAVAALPFTVTLPTGFSITTGRPGPNFNVYTIRRGPQSFVMVYAGPSSQFPIYTGETVQAAGRASIVTVEGSQRRAVEHLFRRQTAPREVHAWVSSLEGTDRITAEQIANSLVLR